MTGGSAWSDPRDSLGQLTAQLPVLFFQVRTTGRGYRGEVGRLRPAAPVPQGLRAAAQGLRHDADRGCSGTAFSGLAIQDHPDRAIAELRGELLGHEPILLRETRNETQGASDRPRYRAAPSIRRRRFSPGTKSTPSSNPTGTNTTGHRGALGDRAGRRAAVPGPFRKPGIGSTSTLRSSPSAPGSPRPRPAPPAHGSDYALPGGQQKTRSDATGADRRAQTYRPDDRDSCSLDSASVPVEALVPEERGRICPRSGGPAICPGLHPGEGPRAHSRPSWPAHGAGGTGTGLSCP